MEEIVLTPPLDNDVIKNLKSGDKIYLTGKIYTARDAAHKKLVEIINNNGTLPINLDGQVIYYVGPSPARPGRVIGSAGPTTSGRMDIYTPVLLEKGLKAMIGKGTRSREVKDAIIQYGAVYLAAVGGAAALISKTVKKAKVIAYPELGPEAIYELEVERFPAIVINDSFGNDLYETGPEAYRLKYQGGPFKCQ